MTVLTNRDIINPNGGLYMTMLNIANVEAEFTFNYARKKNLDKCLSIMKEWHKLKTPVHTPELEKWNAAYIPLMEEYCIKNEKGEPEIKENQYQFTDENKAIINEKLKELEEQHPEWVKQKDEWNEKKKSFLEKEIDFEFYKVKKEFVPKMPGYLFDELDGIMWEESE